MRILLCSACQQCSLQLFFTFGKFPSNRTGIASTVPFPRGAPKHPGAAFASWGRPLPPALIVPWAAQTDKGHLKRRLVQQWSAWHECGAGPAGVGKARAGQAAPRCARAMPPAPLGWALSPDPGAGKPEPRGTSSVLCLALAFYRFLVIDHTDRWQRATGVRRSPGGDPGHVWVSSWLPGWPCTPGHSLRTPGPAGRGVGMALCVCVCASHEGERREALVSLPAIRWEEHSAGKVGQSGGLLLRWSPAPVQSSFRQMAPCGECCHLRSWQHSVITCPCSCQLPACIPATGVQGPPAKSAAMLSTSLVLAMGNPHFYSNYLFSLPHEVHQQLTDRPALAFDLQIKKGCLSWCTFWHICLVLINFTVTSGFKTASFFLIVSRQL